VTFRILHAIHMWYLDTLTGHTSIGLFCKRAEQKSLHNVLRCTNGPQKSPRIVFRHTYKRVYMLYSSTLTSHTNTGLFCKRATQNNTRALLWPISASEYIMKALLFGSFAKEPYGKGFFAKEPHKTQCTMGWLRLVGCFKL